MWNNQGGFQSYDQGGGQGFNSPGGFGTPQQSQEKRSRQRAQNIIPVTVAEVINSTQTDEKFFSGDIEILQVTLVGLVRAVKESATRIDYEVDDMTGPPLEVKQFVDNDVTLVGLVRAVKESATRIDYEVDDMTGPPLEVKQFVDNDDSVPEDARVQSARENTYVRVTGTIRSFSGKKSIVAFKISPVKDMNELTYHILDVVHTHASYAAGVSSGGNNGMTSNGMVTNNNMGGGGTYEGGDNGMITGLTAIQNQVHMAIRNNPTSEGASLDSVFKQIRGVPEKAIRDAIEFLSGEGHIYSTVDDDHFKATDS